MQQNLVLDRMHIFHCICHHFICCNFIFCIFRIWFNIFLSLLLLLKWRGVNWPKNQMDPLLLELISEQICATRLCNQSESFLKRDKSFADTENDLWEWTLTKVDGNVGKRWRRWGKEAEEKVKWESFSRRPVWGLRLHPPPHLTANLTDFQIHYMLSGIIFGSF